MPTLLSRPTFSNGSGWIIDSGFLVSGARNALKGRMDYRIDVFEADELAYGFEVKEDQSELHWAWTSAALVVKLPRPK